MFVPELAADQGTINYVSQLHEDGVITYSIDTSLPLQNWTRRIIGALGAQLDNVRFVEVSDDAEIDFKRVDQMPAGNSSAAGLAVYQYEGDRPTVDLLFDLDAITGNITGKKSNRYRKNALKYTYLHELGHSMALEHPFNAGDGDAMDTDTGFTMMAYDRNDTIYSRTKVKNFTENDIDTMTGIWNDGQTSNFLKVIEENDSNAVKEKPLCFSCGCRH